MAEKEQKEGWGFPNNSRKAHYFVDSMSLCRRYGFYYGDLELGNNNSPDNCSVCAKLLAKREEAHSSPA